MKAALLIVTFLTAFCCMAYELLLAQTLSSILGNTVLRYTITIGLYICSLGIGAFYCDRLPGQSTLRRLINLECYLALAGSLSPALFFFIDFNVQTALFNTPDASWPGWARSLFMHAWIIKLGFISGMEIPLLMKLGEEVESPALASRVLAVDYFGTFVAAVYFPLILFPSVGLMASAVLIGFLNCLAAIGLISMDARPVRERVPLYATTLIMAIWMVLAVSHEKEISEMIISRLFMSTASG